jgi:hypothetical protein
VRRFLAFLMFLLYVNEGPLSATIYAHYSVALFDWVEPWLFDPLPIKLRPFDLIMIIAIFTGVKGARVKPMRSVMIMAMLTTVFFFILGVSRGGDSRAASWQIYLMLAAPAAGFALAATHTKAAHFRYLAKWVVAAGVYRAIRCILFYFFQAREMDPIPAVMTTHNDTVLWVVTMAILVVGALEGTSRKLKMYAYLICPMILAAIHFNNRRLAWVSVAGASIALYLLMQKSPSKKKLQKVGRMMVPVLAVYVVVGWGRPERIFKPLASLSSVSSKPDSSTLARNVENLGLIATGQGSWLTGSGWGHKYVELSNKYSIAELMELWQYVPHNSILGLLGFTGILGVLGFWMMYPTAILLNARVAQLARDSTHRSVGMVGVMTTIAVMNQMFGDMGIFSWVNMYTMSIAWAAALRMPIEAGVWPVLAPLPVPAAPVPPVAAAPSAGPRPAAGG